MKHGKPAGAGTDTRLPNRSGSVDLMGIREEMSGGQP